MLSQSRFTSTIYHTATTQNRHLLNNLQPPVSHATSISSTTTATGDPIGASDTPVQELQYFCIKDKGYHVIVWPKNYSSFDIVRFHIAGIEYRGNLDNYLGEFIGTFEVEPTNKYDPNAIKILAPDGHHVGYVPKDMTAEVRKVTNPPCHCFFYIGKRNGIYFSDCYILRPNVSPQQ